MDAGGKERRAAGLLDVLWQLATLRPATSMHRFALFALFATACADVQEVSTEAEFKKILSNNAAVAVDFFSQTCGPCIMIAPKFKDLAKEYDGKVKFVKVDVQRSYVGVQIRSMPTFHFYVNVRRFSRAPRTSSPPPHRRRRVPARTHTPATSRMVGTVQCRGLLVAADPGALLG